MRNKKNSSIIIIFFISIFNLIAQESCINVENLKELDALWEKSLKETDLDFLSAMVSEDFIWVHNHVSRTDTKKTLLELVTRFLGMDPAHWKSRIQEDVKIIIFGTTGIVHGFTELEFNDGTKKNYSFMRTYAEKEGKCFLIANHTMLIPENERELIRN